MELYLIRHGETDSNKKGTYLGWTDAPLNEDGEKQARIASQKLENIKFDEVYSSPLKRTLKTAEIINENSKSKITLVDSLKERNFGLWDDLTYAEITLKYPEHQNKWINDWVNYKIDEGESAIEAFLRVTTFISDLLERKKTGKYLIVTHLGCIRNIVAYLLGLKIEDSWRFKVDNCGITLFEVNDEGYAFLKGLNI